MHKKKFFAKKHLKIYFYIFIKRDLTDLIKRGLEKPLKHLRYLQHGLKNRTSLKIVVRIGREAVGRADVCT